MPHKLLLADDSVTIQRVIELTFADEDVEVFAVGDGRQAIKRIETDPPDIVLADIGMPEKDGYEVAAFVKNSPKYSHIPVLLLTGAFEPIDEQRAQDVGCDGVLAKPFEPQMVITRVNELLAAAPPRLTASSQTPVQPPALEPDLPKSLDAALEATLPPVPTFAPPFESAPTPAPWQAAPPPAPAPEPAPSWRTSSAFEPTAPPARPAASYAEPPAVAPRPSTSFFEPPAPGLAAPPASQAAPPAPQTAPPTPMSALDAFLSAAPEFDLSTYGLGAEPSTPAQPAAPAPPTSLAFSAAPPAQVSFQPTAFDDPAAAAAIPPPPPSLEIPEFDSGRAPSIPDPEPSEAREMLEPPSVRISRRTPIAIPGFGAPALPQPGTQADLDDYFEKLDAAFASLNQAAPPPTVRPAAVVPPLAQTQPEQGFRPAPAASSPAPSPAYSRPPAPVPEPVPAPFEPAGGIAQAFSALLAAEHGHALPATPAAAGPATALTPELVDDLVERVAQRVLEQLTDRVVREAVTDIVSRVSERLVREEIDRVKSTIK